MSNTAKNNKSAGFTIIEFLIYIAIFSIVITIMVLASINIFRSTSRTRSIQTTTQNGRFALIKIGKEVEESGAIITPTKDQESSNKLELYSDGNLITIKEENNEKRDSNSIVIERNGNSNEIVSNKVNVKNLNFTNINNESLKIELNLEFYNPEELDELEYSNVFYTLYSLPRNPKREDEIRKGHIEKIKNSIKSYEEENNELPPLGLTQNFTEICNVDKVENCLDYININPLIPDHLDRAPTDPTVTEDIKTGYEIRITEEDEIELCAPHSLDSISNCPDRFRLNYTAEEGGTISGDKIQFVLQDRDGTEVVAKPEEGYSFTKWSDGVTSASRTETDVTEDLNIIAEFESNNTLEIIQRENGTIEVDE